MKKNRDWERLKKRLKKVLNWKHLVLVMIVLSYWDFFNKYKLNSYYYWWGFISGMALWFFGAYYLTDKKYRKYYYNFK